MILKVSWDILWTLSFGLSQSHGHGSWLMCEVALRYIQTYKALNLSTMLGGTKNMSYKVLGLYFTYACLSKFNMVNSCEAWLMNIIRIEQLITNEERYKVYKSRSLSLQFWGSLIF
jgi:hypothetical protein